MFAVLTRSTVGTGHSRWSHTAMIGYAGWIIAIVAIQPSPAEAILIFAPLVLVPLGLGLIDQTFYLQPNDLPCRWVAVLQLPAALLLAVTPAMTPGSWAMTLSAPWLFVTLLIALCGMMRLFRNDWPATHEWSIIAGLVFIAIGGGWTLLSRGGIQPLDFSDDIVLLTGVHFHYAGFVLPLLTGLVTKELAGQRSSQVTISRLTVAGVVIGVPMVGVGISISPLVEVVSSLVLAAACVSLAILQCRLAIQSTNPAELSLMTLSSVSLLGGMAFAVIYAIGEFTGAAWIDIPTMVLLHGLANAFGFALCGVLTWTVKN